jgi:hypothetical protein
MKKILLACLLFLILNKGFTQSYVEENGGPTCTELGIIVIRADSTLQETGWIVLEGARYSQDVLLGLVIKHPVYLQSGSEKVYLKLMETLLGDVYTTQVALKPFKKLDVGKTYELVIDSIPLNVNPFQNQVWPRFIVVPSTKTEEMTWTKLPKQLDYRYFQPQCTADIFFPCKNREAIGFSLPIAYPAGSLIRATIENIQTGKKNSQYVLPKDREVELGHTECSGGFEFGSDQGFYGRFEWLLPNGKTMEWKGEAFKFHTYSEAEK